MREGVLHAKSVGTLSVIKSLWNRFINIFKKKESKECVAHMFEKVSYEEFDSALAMLNARFAEVEFNRIYNSIKLPVRSTELSAGYDFFSPIGIHIPADANIIIPTGIKVDLSSCPMPEIKKFLALYPRSSFGFKYGMRLMNTVGIIDQDYYGNPDNEGHIIVAIHSDKEFDLEEGTKFCQGIIQPFFPISSDEVVTTKRLGGIGSTDNNQIAEEPAEFVSDISDNTTKTKEVLGDLIENNDTIVHSNDTLGWG